MAQQAPAQTYGNFLPGGVYGTSKWSGSSAADIFVPAGTPIYAPISGTVQASAAGGPEGQHPIIYLRGDSGLSLRFLHDQATASGHVQAGQRIGTVGDSTLSAAYQHVDLSVSRSGQFQPGPGGGDVDARQFLQQIGYPGQVYPGRTGGVQEMLAGIGPFGGQNSYGGGGGGAGYGGLTSGDVSGVGNFANVGAPGGAGVGGSAAGGASTPAPAALRFANPFADLGSGFHDLPKWALAAAGVGAVVWAVEQRAPREAAILGGITLLGVVMLNPKIEEQLTALASGRFGAVGAQQLSAALGPAGAARSTVTAPGATGSLPGANTAPLSATGGGSGIFGAVPARISFPYGGTPYSFGGRTSHGGVDLQASTGNTIGQPFYAPAGFGEGRVYAVLPEGGGAGTSNSGGQGVIVQIIGGALQGLFAHYYHVGTANVRTGDLVNPGQALGTVGYAAPGDSHLHVELRSTAGVGGRTYDPTQYLQGVLR